MQKTHLIFTREISKKILPYFKEIKLKDITPMIINKSLYFQKKLVKKHPETQNIPLGTDNQDY
ncbi:hypothetical protein NPA43_08455 [Bacillus pumilus]|nr:hypothetical protein NPA43_08455 [Bacillus pumilus]